jgi:hypothetical protein
MNAISRFPAVVVIVAARVVAVAVSVAPISWTKARGAP